jgi:hypothetical protein
MSTEQDEIDAILLDLRSQCYRPSWRFGLFFSARERQLIIASINSLYSKRQHNLLMAELDQRYGPNRGVGRAEQAPARVV